MSLLKWFITKNAFRHDCNFFRTLIIYSTYVLSIGLFFAFYSVKIWYYVRKTVFFKKKFSISNFDYITKGICNKRSKHNANDAKKRIVFKSFFRLFRINILKSLIKTKFNIIQFFNQYVSIFNILHFVLNR